MADFFRIQLGVVSRAEGHSAAKRSAYQSCGIVIAHDGERFDFSRKASEHVRTIMIVPNDAQNWVRDPESLWQRAAAAEKRIDAQEARIVDFSMPRAVPVKLWEDCIRHCYEPFLRKGMVFQIDIHDTPASDGGRNVNIHGLATLREIFGDGFAARKNRQWNDLFRERSGRVIREQFAERLTLFCQGHGIDYAGDARPNSARNLPDPEPNLPLWNFEYATRTGEMPEALAALQEHRTRRREWELAQAAEIEASLDLKRLETRIRAQRQRRITPETGARSSKRDRRAAILRAWHKGGWIDAETIPDIVAVRFDQKRSLLWIDLVDGTTLVDRGDAITMQGPVTWQAALETAAAAERHGWKSVKVSGDQVYKDAVAVACMMRGIEVANHVLSPKGRAVFDKLQAAQAECSEKSNEPETHTTIGQKQVSGTEMPPHGSGLSSQQIHHRITKRRFVPQGQTDGVPGAEDAIPVYRPPSAMAIGVKSKSKVDFI